MSEHFKIEWNRSCLHKVVDARIKSAHDEKNKTVMAVLVTAIHALFSCLDLTSLINPDTLEGIDRLRDDVIT